MLVVYFGRVFVLLCVLELDIYIFIIAFSIIFNFSVGQAIFSCTDKKKITFITGVIVNVGLLVFFKYTDFFIATINAVFDSHIPLANILLPIGISFYTFQQISYLSDIYTSRHDPTSEGVVHYALFISFFPQLVAGPIVHHREMMPQFADAKNKDIDWKNMYTGLCYLSMGLAKKILVADSFSPVVKHCFDDRASMTFLEACFGSVAYTLQLYFDFSGYTDMAIGCALFFNIHLPLNFNSPYKAVNIQEFWRRWHMTLSRWLRDYLYIPLGGSKSGDGRTLSNLFLTFLIGGIWHGAGWTFVLWGALHGAALVVHRVWSKMWGRAMPAFCGWGLTFVFVSLAWIPFRAVSFERLNKIVDALLGYNGFYIRDTFKFGVMREMGFDAGSFGSLTLFILCALLVVFATKNSQEILQKTKSKIVFVWSTLLLACSLLAIFSPGYRQEFIYFQF